MKEQLDRLRDTVLAKAPHPGRTDADWPGLYFFRADAPVGPKRTATNGVVVAVIADRSKTVAFANDRILRYEPGSFLFVTGEARYTSRVTRATPQRPYLSFGLELDPLTIAQTLVALHDADDDTPIEDQEAWVGHLDDKLADAFLRLLSSLDDPVELKLVTPLVVKEIVFRLLRSDHAEPLRRAVRTDDGRIRDAMRFIYDNYDGPLTIDALAKTVMMSPSHFAHRFRDIARVSPMRFVKHVRLRQARLLLLEGLRASEVAEQVGYASPSHFTRDFKSHYGASPGAYAKALEARVAAG